MGRALKLFLFWLLVGGTSNCVRAELLITVEKGDWGRASIRDIKTVLQSVGDTMMQDFPNRGIDAVVVRHGQSGPRVLARKTEKGAYRVELNVQDARWSQFAYQFAHELCHIFSNYDQRPVASVSEDRAHQWFEEALCDAVSIYTLRRMASVWRDAPPHPGWEGYASAFEDYAQRLTNAQHRQLAADDTFKRWYARNLRDLEANPYLRVKNELIALQFVSLFDSSPGSVRAIGYLHRETPARPGFDAYLTSWLDCCPPEIRNVVLRIIALFDAQNIGSSDLVELGRRGSGTQGKRQH